MKATTLKIIVVLTTPGEWLLDSGASSHVCKIRELFTDYGLCTIAANGIEGQSQVAGIVTITIQMERQADTSN